MQKLCLVVLALSALTLVGCASPKFNYKPAAIDVSEPPLNELVQRSVGEEMVQQGKLALMEVLNVTTATNPHWGVTINPGIFRKTGSDTSASYYGIGGTGGDSGSIDKSWVIDPLKSIMVKKSDNSICVVTIFHASACTDTEQANYKQEIRRTVFDNALQQTLIYSGRIGTRIRLGYREFSNNLARPAFSNDVEYDLTESRAVAYKGALIEVVDATNQYIKYIVKKNFNAAIGLGPAAIQPEPVLKHGNGGEERVY